MPPWIWARYSPIPICTSSSFGFAQRAGVMSALGKGGDLADGFDIGRKPGQSMGGALLAVEQALDGVGLDPHALAHRRGRVPQHRFRGERRLAGKARSFSPASRRAV